MKTYFKKVNDNYGHQAGDNALKFIASILADRIRETDFLARFGGEEFVILLPKTEAIEAENLANDIRITIEKASFHYSGEKVSITVSGGVSEFKKGDKPEDVFNRADEALYVCKESGRNCITIK
ncbi:MAG: GGDEF domain-containing protein [Methylococcales bacterium]|nr:GGDEF domain-containing protein [Methylococcales bacterium]MBT7445744.1 GGDEF domain-containing protein [Methylococcales bacterium]